MTAPRLAYVIDPRFAGGTSAAVAAELRVAAGMGRVTVHARCSAMFGADRQVAPALREVLDELALPLVWDAPEIAADLVILHNPAFLKFQPDFGGRLLARHLVVVAHENFLRPGGVEGFDVGACLARIDRASLALRKSIAPVSAHNRTTVETWLANAPAAPRWDVLDSDWFNICDMAPAPPTDRPRDRRGRHSRPGFEKFPPLADLDRCFPAHAEANVILGADMLLAAGVVRPHWTMLPFRSVEVEAYFGMIDFLVYFTAPTWRESFGRVIAEALAAGKVVLTDPETGAAFGTGVLPCTPAEVDAAIARLVTDPAAYRAQAARGQAVLAGLSRGAFETRLAALIAGVARDRAA
ncbi:MAG: glycosyltransferase [Rhodovulum sp.]